jgi:hypothetical protein
MLAGLRCRFLFSFFLLALLLAVCLPSQAQINGVPASVTSFGFGGSTNPTPGVRASVTSLGPNGYGTNKLMFGTCCPNIFFSANPNPPLFSTRRHHRRGDHDRGNFAVGIFEPAYIPYAVPYPVEVAADENDNDGPSDGNFNAESIRASGPRKPAPPHKRVEDREPSPKDQVEPKPAPPDSEGEVSAQPSTVLIYKDGHHSDILNYAIVGDTLFDLGAGRARKILLADLDLIATHKANDDRGVDFQIPASAKGQ